MANQRKMNHTDRRVKRTKKALRDALLTLLENKSINEITVTELTTLADVNRATFYFYYIDLLDMLQQVQNEAYESFRQIIDESNESISSLEGFTAYCEKVLVFCKEHENLCRFIVKNDVNNQLYKYIQNILLNNVPNSKDTFSEENPARYLSNYVLTAMTGVMIDWMDDGMRIPPHEVAEFCANVYINGSVKTKEIYSVYTAPDAQE